MAAVFANTPCSLVLLSKALCSLIGQPSFAFRRQTLKPNTTHLTWGAPDGTPPAFLSLLRQTRQSSHSTWKTYFPPYVGKGGEATFSLESGALRGVGGSKPCPSFAVSRGALPRPAGIAGPTGDRRPSHSPVRGDGSPEPA